MTCGREDCNKDREANMVAVKRGLEDGGRAVFCDPCIAPIVNALNTSGLETNWSCCGHGLRPAVIGLVDGRQIVIANSLEQCRQITAGFPSINDASKQSQQKGESMSQQANVVAINNEIEPTFTLRGQDRFMPEILEFWAAKVDAAVANTVSGAADNSKRKAKMARALAHRVRAWQELNRCKTPD